MTDDLDERPASSVTPGTGTGADAGSPVAAVLRPDAVRLGRAGRRLLRSDVALLYAGVVLAMFAAGEVGSLQALVRYASTNLANLRAHPVQVLLLSAFVVSEPADLLLLPVLIVVYALAQRQLGRAPTVVAIVIGHLLATLCVATLLVAGIFHGQLQQSIAVAVDVGFSYGLSCVTGLLLTAVPRGLRLPYVAILLGLWSWPLLLGSPLLTLTHPTFTDVGHTLALLCGLALSTLPGSRPPLHGDHAVLRSSRHCKVSEVDVGQPH